MAAATGDRNTLFKLIRDTQAYPVKAAVRIFAGTLVGIDATGHAIPGADAAGMKIVGVAAERKDNLTGANAALKVQVYKCVAKFANGVAGDAVAQAHVGLNAEVLDDQTVANTAGAAVNNIVAGVIREVEADGVWIEVGL